jgi:hypothetical protein
MESVKGFPTGKMKQEGQRPSLGAHEKSPLQRGLAGVRREGEFGESSKNWKTSLAPDMLDKEAVTKTGEVTNCCHADTAVWTCCRMMEKDWLLLAYTSPSKTNDSDSLPYLKNRPKVRICCRLAWPPFSNRWLRGQVQPLCLSGLSVYVESTNCGLKTVLKLCL